MILSGTGSFFKKELNAELVKYKLIVQANAGDLSTSEEVRNSIEEFLNDKFSFLLKS